MSQLTPEQTWKLKQVLYGSVLDELDKSFGEINTNYMPIKGAYLLCTGLAEKLPVRTINDLDILVSEKDFDKVSTYFGNNKNVKFKEHFWEFETIFEYEFNNQKVVIEIHKKLNYEERFLLPTQDLFDRGIQTESQRILPCPEDALLITLCHLLVHIVYHPNYCIYDEMKLYIFQENFSWDRFWEFGSKTGIMPFLYYGLRVLQRQSDVNICYTKKFLYPDLLCILPKIKLYGRYFSWIRRLLFELPFSRDPLGLVVRKLKKSKM